MLLQNIPNYTTFKTQVETLENMEDMLAEAVKDMGDLGMEDDHINEILSSPPPKQTASDDHDDTFAELDAMLNDADKELNELLNS